MKNYLRYLHADIEDAIDRAPSLLTREGVPEFSDEEEDADALSYRFVTIAALTGLPAEAFPPENLLDDEQVKALLEAIAKLWEAWNLDWTMPMYLPVRKQYAAMIRQVGDELIAYDITRGGKVLICDYEGGKICPFLPEDKYCFCKDLEDSTKHDIAIWEEHVRSQGIDPYRELSSEEEEAFEREMRQRYLRKRYGDDWKKYAHLDFTPESDENCSEELFYEKFFDDEPEEDLDWNDDDLFLNNDQDDEEDL